MGVVSGTVILADRIVLESRGMRHNIRAIHCKSGQSLQLALCYIFHLFL
jgi:hypothetical protein